jgi:hypothetical protein
MIFRYPFLKGTKVFLSGKPDIEQYTNNAGEAKSEPENNCVLK